MSLVFSSIVPHSPLLIPQIGKENLARLDQTSNAYNKLALELKSSQTETIIIISPHGIIQDKTFTMNLSPEFSADYEEFGDFSTKFNITGNVGLTYRIKEKLETKVNLQLISEQKLDYGISVPLKLLAGEKTKIKIIPLYYSGLDLNAHYQFGLLLKKIILASKENIGVIASGDLSHRLHKNAPGGFSPKAKKFDSKVIEILLKNNASDLLNINQDLITEAGECGLKSILILSGIMEGIKYEPQLLSYESPFGVGYMVMNLKL